MNTTSGELDLGEVDMADVLANGEFAAPADKWPQTLAEMVDVLVDDFERSGQESDAAIEHAQHIVMLLAEYQGGRPIYMPRGDRLRQALRDRSIYLMHRGDNVEQLADRFGLTVRHIQRVYCEQRAIQIRKRQGRLFDDSAPQMR